MDFKKNYQNIEKLLKISEYRKNKTKKKSYLKGVYIFTKTRDTEYHKIGLAAGEGGIFQRLRYYTICYPAPKEYILEFCITTKTRKEPKRLEKLFHNDPAFKKYKNEKASQEWVKILDGMGGLSKIEQAEDMSVGRSKDKFNRLIVDILDKNRNAWEYVIAFGKDGVLVKKNDEQLDEIQDAYVRVNLPKITDKNVKEFFKDRDETFFVWTSENKVVKVGDEINVEGEGEAVVESLKKETNGSTTACIKFPDEETCTTVNDFYNDIEFSDEVKEQTPEPTQDLYDNYKVGDVIAILAPKRTRRGRGRSFYLAKIHKFYTERSKKKYAMVKVQFYDNKKEDGAYVLEFEKKDGKGVGKPILHAVYRDSVMSKVQTVKGMRGKLTKDELQRLRGLAREANNL